MSTQLPRYEIVREVSRGVHASVFQAIDREEDRPVALKVYEIVDDDHLSQLRAETRMLHALDSHPGLPVVRHSFVDDGRYVIVMDWVDGTDLQTILEEEGAPGLPFDQVNDVIGQVAAALDRLHRHVPPIVHGDVKPANLVRRLDGRVVLVDFGMAAEPDGARVGTRGFMAPEVAHGEKASPSADVFGLAATAVALLTGGAPVGDRVVPDHLDAAVAAGAARVLQRGLSTDPAARPASATDLAEQLLAARAGVLPSGVVTFLATELARSVALWDEHPAEMRSVSGRLGHMVAATIETSGGHVVSTMGEGERTVSVFTRASSAAAAALALHERVRDEQWPFGLRIALRAAIETGEADWSRGVYISGAIDRVVWMRSHAAPGTTVTSQATTELLRGHVDDDVRIVPVGEVAPPDGTRAQHLFAVVSEGTEPDLVNVLPAAVPVAASAAALDPVPTRPPVRRVVAEAIQQPVPLSAWTITGLAIVYLAVLGPVFGLAVVAGVVAVIAGGIGTAATVRGTRAGLAVVGREQYEAQERRALAARAAETQARNERNQRDLATGFAAVGSEQGVRVLDGLVDAYERFRSVASDGTGGSAIASALPLVADETFVRGLSACSDALQYLSEANPARRRRVQAALEEAEASASAGHADPAMADVASERVARYRTQIEEIDRQQRAAESLLGQAERCEGALREARRSVLEVRGAASEAGVDSVVATLESTVHRVREVQEAFRRLER